MHTNETLSKSSEHEINIMVADIRGQKYTERIEHGDVWLDKEQDETLDYCQNPEDIMPIAIANKIGQDWSHSDVSGVDYWRAWGSTQGMPGQYERFETVELGAYRAVCIIYILMNQGE